MHIVALNRFEKVVHHYLHIFLMKDMQLFQITRTAVIYEIEFPEFWGFTGSQKIILEEKMWEPKKKKLQTVNFHQWDLTKGFCLSALVSLFYWALIV